MITVKLSIVVYFFIISIYLLFYFKYVNFYSNFRNYGNLGDRTDFNYVDILLTLWPFVKYFPKWHPNLMILIEFLLSLFSITTVVLLYAIDHDSIMDSGLWISMAYSVSTILACFNLWFGHGISLASIEILGYVILSISELFESSGKIDLNFVITIQYSCSNWFTSLARTCSRQHSDSNWGSF